MTLCSCKVLEDYLEEKMAEFAATGLMRSGAAEDFRCSPITEYKSNISGRK